MRNSSQWKIHINATRVVVADRFSINLEVKLSIIDFLIMSKLSNFSFVDIFYSNNFLLCLLIIIILTYLYTVLILHCRLLPTPPCKATIIIIIIIKLFSLIRHAIENLSYTKPFDLRRSQDNYISTRESIWYTSDFCYWKRLSEQATELLVFVALSM